jgi:hypothetical protein
MPKKAGRTNKAKTKKKKNNQRSRRRNVSIMDILCVVISLVWFFYSIELVKVHRHFLDEETETRNLLRGANPKITQPSPEKNNTHVLASKRTAQPSLGRKPAPQSRKSFDSHDEFQNHTPPPSPKVGDNKGSYIL